MSATTHPQMSVYFPLPLQPSRSRFSHLLRPTTNTVQARYRTILAASKGATSPLERISHNTARHSPHTSNPNIRDNTKPNIKRKMFPHRNRRTNSDKLATMRMIQPQTWLVNSQIRTSERLHANQALLVDNPRRAHDSIQTARHLKASRIAISKATSQISRAKEASSILLVEMPPAHLCLLPRRLKCQKRTRTSTARMFKSVGKPFIPRSRPFSKRT